MTAQITITLGEDIDRHTFYGEVPEEFAAVMAWLLRERTDYQSQKWDYDEDIAHAREGLGPDSWFWTKGIENYAQRVRIAHHDMDGDWWEVPHAVQAVLKLAATMIAIPEALLRHTIDTLPKPGFSSGTVLEWQDLPRLHMNPVQPE